MLRLVIGDTARDVAERCWSTELDVVELGIASRPRLDPVLSCVEGLSPAFSRRLLPGTASMVIVSIPDLICSLVCSSFVDSSRWSPGLVASKIALTTWLRRSGFGDMRRDGFCECVKGHEGNHADLSPRYQRQVFPE